MSGLEPAAEAAAEPVSLDAFSEVAPSHEELQNPYPGLRPYNEADAARFFGRGRDAQRIRNKILSASLTLFYAPSGMGKTSLLRALVIPELRDRQRAFVVYFDTWVGASPAEELRAQIRASAERDADLAAWSCETDPSLVSLAVALQACGRSFVLVLDQFEEPLTRRPDVVDALRTELAELVRGPYRAHVVFALREEFLASLQALQSEFLGIFASTYRVEALSGSDAEAAIREPAATTGVSYEGELVTALVAGLRETAASLGSAAALRQDGVALPLLQIVCHQLWASARRAGLSEITLPLYSELGGRDGILQAYVEELMAGFNQTEAEHTARILTELAPASGLKLPYLPSALARLTGLSTEHTLSILARLEKARVVRSRRSGSNVFYELWHDAFTKVLAPWLERQSRVREAQLRRRTLGRLALAVAAPLVAVLLVAVVIGGFQEYERTWGVLDDIGQRPSDDSADFATNQLDSVAIYLWSERDVDKLLDVLEEAGRRGLFRAGQYRRASYGGGSWAQTEVQVKGVDTPLLSIETPEVPADTAALMYAWRELASTWRAAGIAMPAAVQVVSGNRPEGVYRAKLRRFELAELESAGPAARKRASVRPVAQKLILRERDLEPSTIELNPDELLLNAEGLDADAREVLESERREWPARQALVELGLSDWWWIPVWSLPLWKAAEHKAVYPAEAAVALHFILALERDPALFLRSAGLEQALLRQQATMTPHLVDSACRASGGLLGLTRTVDTWLSTQPLSHLPYLLETLAGPRRVASSKRDSLDACDLDHAVPGGIDEASAKLLSRAFDESLPELAAARPVRVRLATNLVPALTTEGALREEVLKRIGEFRRRVEEQRGIAVPGFNFREDPGLPEGQFEVQLRGELESEPMPALSLDPAGEIMAALEGRILQTLPAWVDITETVRLMDAVPSELRDWVRESYELEELKLILREAMSPGGSSHLDIAPDRVAASSSDAGSLVDFNWLMASLAFWKHACPPRDYACLGEGLRQTQMAGSEPPADTSELERRALVAGVAALVAGKFESAEQQFASVSPQLAARSEFSRRYARARSEVLYRDLADMCNPEVPGRLAFLGPDGDTSSQVRALLQRSAERLTAIQSRRLRLCLGESPFVEEALAGDTRDWAAIEKYWLGHLAIQGHQGEKASPTSLSQAEPRLAEAIGELPLQLADQVFGELLELCAPPTGAWCFQMLDRIAEQRVESYWIPLLLANHTTSGSRSQSERALQLLERAAGNLSSVKPNQRAVQSRWLTFLRAQSYQHLAGFGASGARERAMELLQGQVRESPLEGAPTADQIRSALASVLLARGESERATRLIEDGLRKAPGSADLLFWKSSLLLRSGAYGAIAKLLEGISREDTLFERALARILDRDAESFSDVYDFLGSSHPYRDYVRLIYYWRLMRDGHVEEAKKLLWTRRIEIDPDTWQERLQPEQGDYLAVWRERLILYYLGELPSEELSADLEDEARFARSPFAEAEVSRLGFLCEWRFYDALLQSVSGDAYGRQERFIAALHRVRETQQHEFYEHAFAVQLLERESAQPADSGTQVGTAPPDSR